MKKVLFWVYPVIWMGVIYYSSDQPYQKQDIKPFLSEYIDLSFLEPVLQPVSFTYHQSVVSVEHLGAEGFIEFFIRKGAHVGVFFILCLLFYYALTKTFLKSDPKLVIFIAFSATVIYAIFDEWHQGWTPNRTPYVGDVLLDSFGAFIAVGTITLLKIIKNSKTSY